MKKEKITIESRMLTREKKGWSIKALCPISCGSFKIYEVFIITVVHLVRGKSLVDIKTVPIDIVP